MSTNTRFKPSPILSEHIDRVYRRRILETIASIGAGVSITYAVLFWFVYQASVSAITDCIYAAAYLWTFYWIKQRRYTLSAYWVIFWAELQITLGSILFVGPETGFQLYFFTLPVIIYLLLAKEPRWAKALTLMLGTLAFIASHTIHFATYRAPITEPVAQAVFIVNALVVFGAIFFTIKYFADEIVIAYKKQKQLVLKDSLTGLSNDRYIHEHASKLLSLCDRYGHPVSVILFDIDQFKQINESNGQSIGNQILQHVANTILNDIRDADILARIGGDEFLILLPETTINNAANVAIRLQQELDSSQFTNQNSALRVTASFGVTFCDSNIMATIDELICSASLALEKARLQGGNCVEVEAQTQESGIPLAVI